MILQSRDQHYYHLVTYVAIILQILHTKFFSLRSCRFGGFLFFTHQYIVNIFLNHEYRSLSSPLILYISCGCTIYHDLSNQCAVGRLLSYFQFFRIMKG